MSRLSVDLNRHDGEDSRRQQLLALHELRGDLERCASSEQQNGLPVAVTSTGLRRDLEELLAALDRRTPLSTPWQLPRHLPVSVQASKGGIQ